MSSLFDGIEEAEIYERGKFLEGGFKGDLKVKKTLAKETLRSGIGFIVEFEVITSNLPDVHPVGSRVTWFQKMTDKTVALPAIKAWAAAVAGYASHDKEGIAREVAPMLNDTLTHATENPTQNDFVGAAVHVETTSVKTRAGNDFTRHAWEPVD